MHRNTLTYSRTPQPLGGPHYTRSLTILNSRSRGPAPYTYRGPQTISRTFLIIPENPGTLYRRPFLDRSRQHENSREAARHLRNVSNCAVYRNYTITEWRNLNTLRTIPRDAGEMQNIIRNNTFDSHFNSATKLVNDSDLNHESNQNQIIFAWTMNRIESHFS